MAHVSLTPDHYTRRNFQSRDYQGIVRSPVEDCIIEIAAAGIELDLNGSVLDGEDSLNTGIYLHDCESVTIKNGVIKGFYYGIRAVNVGKLTIQDCVISDNHNPKDRGWLSDTNNPVEEGFGGGIHLLRVAESLIAGNLLHNNFNGISLVRSEGNRILKNDASYSGNIGIHLLASSHNTIQDNRADHCIRFAGRFWCDTADSAGILLEEYSHHNRVLGNSMRYSGDGFFIRANNNHACNHNFITGNDGSYSPNNAFEAVFSEHNVFEKNIADFSNYGFWLGYSRNTTVKDNQIGSNRFDGIAIEYGQQNNIGNNRIEGNRNGIRLWRDGSTQAHTRTASQPPACIISANEIRNSRECAVTATEDQDVRLKDNIYEGNQRDFVSQPAK